MTQNTFSRTAQPIAALIVAAAVLFPNLGGPRLWDRDEPRNAGCAREMLARHDWVTPTFNEQLRSHKPVLLYWGMLAAYGVFGVNEFAARFWSAALGVATAGLTCGLGARLFGGRTGLWAAVAIVTSLMFGVAGRAATPDSLFIFCCTLALYVYVREVFPLSRDDAARWSGTPDWFPRSWTFAVRFYACLGLAVLAKGPAGLILPTAIVGMFLLVMGHERRARWPRSAREWAKEAAAAARHFVRTCWRMRPLTAICIVAAVALPWYVWVGLRTDGRFLWEFLVDHNLNRARRPMEGHAGPFLYYVPAIMVGFFPWSIFLIPTFIEAASVARAHDRRSAGIVFCLAWLGVWVGIFSLARTKLPSYVTPSYPALALLTAFFLDRWQNGASAVREYWPRVGVAILAAVGIAVLIAVPVATAFFLPGEPGLAGVGLIPLAAAGGWFWSERRSRREAAVRWLGGGAVAFSITLFAIVAQRVDAHQHSDRLLAAIAARSPAPQLAAYGVLEPSWVYYSGQSVRELPPPTAAAPETSHMVVEFLAQGPDRFVITTRRRLAELDARLPSGVGVLAAAPYFLKKDELVVLGHHSPRSASRPDPLSPPIHR